ncbi:uncharacterized protein pgc [Drosophila virilis]|uniref:Uncharacterized protein n=1 Tax=Drosophila virilis TaxID=7244 RepID=B4LMX3_DROVI|nr:uncharacterized protein LOC6625797 [Drosophila virilis]EDW62088.1 uncharacterized protein Dvir_GJ22404 [Drosophila virilis]
MCDYEHEYSFTFDESTLENELSGRPWDCGFESMWQRIGEELRREQEINELDHIFQEKLKLQCCSQMDSWM